MILSAFNALTLSPALSTLLLKPRDNKKGLLRRFFDWFNRVFTRATNGYVKVAGGLIRKSALAFVVLLACGVLAGFFANKLPSSFLPDEDQGYMFLNLQLPQAASLQRTEATAAQIEDMLAKTPGVDPDRIFIAGHSAGGTLAMLGAMTSKRFKACASFSGSPDQVSFARAQDELVVFDKAKPQEFAMRSPLAYYQSFKCPARFYYGDEELAFKFSTQKLAEKASGAGTDAKAVEITGDHFTAVDPAIRQAITFFQSK